VWMLIRHQVHRVKEEVSTRISSRQSTVVYGMVCALVLVGFVRRCGVYVNVCFLLIVVLSVCLPLLFVSSDCLVCCCVLVCVVDVVFVLCLYV
jgi:hypothetical protein